MRYSGMQCVHAHLHITRIMNYSQLISFNINNKKLKSNNNMVPYMYDLKCEFKQMKTPND